MKIINVSNTITSASVISGGARRRLLGVKAPE